MPYVSNQGVRIHYEVEGHGPPLILQHGLASSITRWRQFGYVKELSGDYSLILVDSRGHGDSEKPRDAQAYGPEQMTGDIVAVMNDLGVEKASYWGYSMGGMIGFQLMRHYPSRFISYIIGGMSPYARTEAEKQFAAVINMMLSVGADEGPGGVVSLMEKTLGRALSVEEKKRWLGEDFILDYQALTLVSQNLATWPPMGDLLPTVTVPCLLFAGEKDPFHDGAREASKHNKHASFVSIPDLEHGTVFERSDLIIPHARKFLSNITRKESYQ